MAHTINLKVEGHEISIPEGEDVKLYQENTDYNIAFDLDTEWSNRSSVTAVFQMGDGDYIDVAVSNGTCKVPLISKYKKVTVGLYSDQSNGSTTNFISTTGVVLNVAESIMSKRRAELPGSINMSTEEAIEYATAQVKALETAVNNVIAGKTAVLVDVT